MAHGLDPNLKHDSNADFAPLMKDITDADG
jgi:hypothetical protein